MRFKGFEGEWEKIKVSDLLDFYSTNSLSWEQLDYEEGNIRNLHYGLIHKGLPTLVDLQKDKLPFVKSNNTPKNYTLCMNGDVAFADASEDTNDVAKAVEFQDCTDSKVICGLHTIHGRDNHEKTEIGFKGYAFSSFAFHKQIRRIAQGTKIYSISTRNFDETYIGIPSKDEQKKIVKLLALLDERIATQNKIIEDLKKLKSAISVNLFDECFSNEKLVSLKNISTIVRRKNDGLNHPVMMISAEHGFINQSEKYDNDNAGNSLANYTLLYKGELSYNRGSSKIKKYGSVFCLYVQNALVPYVYHSFRMDNSVADFTFYSLLLNSRQLDKELVKVISSTARMDGLLNISKEDFFSIKVPLPDMKKQRKIASILNEINVKIENEKKMYSLLCLQRNYLLSQMFI